jgi:hypothetical protein
MPQLVDVHHVAIDTDPGGAIMFSLSIRRLVRQGDLMCGNRCGTCGFRLQLAAFNR